MDNDELLRSNAQQQQKFRLGIDAVVNNLKRNQAANGVRGSPIQISPHIPNQRAVLVCIECGGPSYTEICEKCLDGGTCEPSSMPIALTSAACASTSAISQQVCPLCVKPVYPDLEQQRARRCNNCKLFVHRECDTTMCGLSEFVCLKCRRSPMLSRDVMLSGPSPSSPLIDHDHGMAQPEPSMPLAGASGGYPPQFRPSSPHQESIGADFAEMYQPLSEDISSPATTSSARDPSPFYPENSPSDIDEDFVPGRGGYRGRGGKKKPGRGGPSKMKIPGKPPMGVPGGFPEPSGRGKRGKRGSMSGMAGKNGKGSRGGRGRGRGMNAASNMSNMMQQAFLQQIFMQQQHQHQQQHLLQHQQMQQMPSMQHPVPLQMPLIREVDEHMVEQNERFDRVSGEKNEYVRTVVLTEENDPFFESACLCLVCGSVGRDSEGVMVACASCAQTYHTYCVGLHEKISQAVQHRGWRCLDCTICEGCGESKDETKLINCIECDVSYHIYCLSPPMERLPTGAWRCQWCARCRRCNMRVTCGSDLNREGLCISCRSLKKCPKCAKQYQLGDKIIRCSACTRWYHGTCEDLYNDEMLDTASQNKMRCSFCRPSQRNSAGIILDAHSNAFFCDNVALNKTAEEILTSKFMPNYFRSPMAFDPMGMFHRSDSFDHYGSIDDDNFPDDMEFVTSGRGRGMGRGGGPGRKVPKLGVGGFFVKIPRRQTTTEEEEVDADGNKKLKRPRKPRKSILDDSYPPSIQEGFFGIQPVEGKSLVEKELTKPTLEEFFKGPHQRVGGHELSHEAAENLRNDLNEKDLLENMDLGDVNLDDINIDDFSEWMDDEDDDLENSLSGLDGSEQKHHPNHNHGHHHGHGGHEQRPAMLQPKQELHSVGNYGVPPNPNAPTFSRSSSQMEREVTNGQQENSYSARWQEDEKLGLQATKAAVLFANEAHPELKEKYPEPHERMKAIQRYWRVLETDVRQEFVNRARENRAQRTKQPRVRKINSTQSVDSPTIQSPVPNQFVRGPGPMAMMNIPGTSQMRPDFAQQQHLAMNATQQQQMETELPTVRVTNHLSQQDLEYHHNLQMRTADLKKHQDQVENELAKYRKQKKNLAAKKRAMLKNAANDPTGQQPTELSEQDRQLFDQLQNLIPLRQAELEEIKKDSKRHQNQVADWERKMNIVRQLTEPERMAMQQHQQRASGGGQMPMNGPMGMPARMPGHHMGMPPHPGPSGFGQYHPQFQPMRVPQQVPYGTIPGPSGLMGPHVPPGFMLRPPPGGLFRPQHSPVLGGVRYEQLQTQLEREIYEIVDDMVRHVSQNPMDGRGEARDSTMLKRLLEPNAGTNNLSALHGAPLQHQSANLMGLNDPEAPRAKKKRTQPKKAGASGSDQDLLVGRIRTQLILLEQIPRAALEPAPRNPGTAFASIGMSELPDTASKKSLLGFELGKMQLRFVDDYFSGPERGPEILDSDPPSMIDIILPPNKKEQVPYAQQIIAMLHQAQMPEDSEVIADKEDAQFGLFDVMSSLISSAGRFDSTKNENIRVGCRQPLDTAQPLEPHRHVFHVERPTLEEVDISMVVKIDPKEDPATAVQELLSILGVDHQIPYQMDTPPLSPEREIAEITPVVKKEIFDQDTGARCRVCEQQIRSSVFSSISIEGLASVDEGTTCSMKCYYQLVAANNVPLSHEQLMQAEMHVDEETLAKLRQITAENFAKCIQNQGKAPTSMQGHPAAKIDSLLTSPKEVRYSGEENKKDNVHLIRVADLSALQEANQRRESSAGPSDQWKVYGKEELASFIQIQAAKQKLLMDPKMGVTQQVPELDQRVCLFCSGRGDGEPSVCGRLLQLGANDQHSLLWVHVNCALWSAEVYENSSGGLAQVDAAVIRSTGLQCNLCGRVGASIQCHKVECGTNFHLLCAKKVGGKFIKDRTFFCPKHSDIAHEVIVNNLDAMRRIYIERNEVDILKRLFDHGDGKKRFVLRLGGLCFQKIGQLLPDQLKTFHTPKYIYPNGFTVSRMFWSTTDPRKRAIYKCTISDTNHKPVFTVTCSEIEQPFCGPTPSDVWMSIFKLVKAARDKLDCLRFFPQAVQGETLYGLSESAITKIAESLPGIDMLFTYTFRHAGSPLLELPLAENPSGCARCEPHLRTLVKHKSRPMASSSSGISKAEGRVRAARPTSFTDELMAAQMKLMMGGNGGEWGALIGGRLESLASNAHSYSLYQKMRKEWKQTVYLARSKIQGLGLYAKRDINMGDMIIEYKGEVIRHEVGEMREKKYEAQNRGVYMFRIDDDLLVDATMAGGCARYINHSCDPNCSTKILTLGPSAYDKKIIITANRPIKALEELTYDYQFELEDDTTKIPCLCGAPNCVKWMN